MDQNSAFFDYICQYYKDYNITINDNTDYYYIYINKLRYEINKTDFCISDDRNVTIKHVTAEQFIELIDKTINIQNKIENAFLCSIACNQYGGLCWYLDNSSMYVSLHYDIITVGDETNYFDYDMESSDFDKILEFIQINHPHLLRSQDIKIALK